jgi:hypothetical protein
VSLLLLGFLAVSTAPESLSTTFVTHASTKALAEAVLPPEIARKMRGHALTPPILNAFEGYFARFWGDAAEIAPGFCQRDTYYVSMPQPNEGVLKPGTPTSGKQIAMASDCSKASASFIHLNGTPPEKAVEVLRWLSEAQADARTTHELKFDLECRSELDPDPCKKGGRAVLAGLPLAQTYILERGGMAYGGDDWRISIKPSDASNLYWQLSIFNWSTNRRRLRISWDVIPPF